MDIKLTKTFILIIIIYVHGNHEKSIHLILHAAMFNAVRHRTVTPTEDINAVEQLIRTETR